MWEVVIDHCWDCFSKGNGFIEWEVSYSYIPCLESIVRQIVDIIDMKFIVLLVDVFNDRLRLIFGDGVVVSDDDDGGDDDDDDDVVVVLFNTDDHIDINGTISYWLLIDSNA